MKQLVRNNISAKRNRWNRSSSLYSIGCKSCGTHCCNGSPIMAEREKSLILLNTRANHLKKEEQGYYVIERDEHGFCRYLLDNKCSLQHAKPLDCRNYPVDPVFLDKKRICFVIDASCYVHGRLSPEFIANAVFFSICVIKPFSYAQFMDYWGKYKNRPGNQLMPLPEYLKEKDSAFMEQIRLKFKELDNAVGHGSYIGFQRADIIMPF